MPGNRNNVILPNLDPDTPYNIKVTAMYGDGAGGELEGNGRTGMNRGHAPFQQMHASLKHMKWMVGQDFFRADEFIDEDR